MARRQAILLVGPTGSGKTPLGDELQRRGLRGRPCRHFDFGRELRRIAAGTDGPANGTGAEIEFIRSVLRTGALLEDEQFPLAEKVLRAFLDEDAGCDALVVLNGLPRHAGQARDVDRLLDVEGVVVLSCPDEVALARVRMDAGGDRNGRADDDEPSLRRKLALFAQRTGPLVEHYRRRGVPVMTVQVGRDTPLEELWRRLHDGAWRRPDEHADGE